MNPSKPGPVAGISLSESPDLAALGYGVEHLNELTLTVAGTLLRLGSGDARWSLAYGGDLRPGGFTWNIFNLARGEDAGRGQRLYSYLAWPYYLDLSKSDEAELINVCNFVRVTPQQAGFPEVPWNQRREDPALEEGSFVLARCLSTMRDLMTRGGAEVLDRSEATPPMAARIILGGKVSGYSGTLPGLFEEFLLAWEQQVPIYVLGGLGGAAGVLGRAILGAEGEPLPPELGLDWQRRHTAGLPDLLACYERHPEVEQPQALYERLAAAVTQARLELLAGGDARLRNGLTPTENRLLIRTEDPLAMRRLLAQGLDHPFLAS